MHRRKLHTFDIENRTFGSHPAHNEWLVGLTFSELFSTDALALIVDDLVTLRENPDFHEKILTRKNIDKHLKIKIHLQQIKNRRNLKLKKRLMTG